jgi:hypothetical protein
MATRALVGFITDKPELIATYNHYDGYPENLGKGLSNFYEEPNEALKIASLGYISYLDPETGEIDAKHKEAPSRVNLSGMNFEDAMLRVAEEADSFGADYIYIYDSENMEWVDVKMYGTRQSAEALMQALMPMGYELFGPNIKDLPAAPDQYVNEGDMEKVMSQAFFKLQDQPKEMVKAYKDSLANDIRLHGPETYADYSVEDFIEDYDNYIADKMAMESFTKRKWQHRAGIIK